MVDCLFCKIIKREILSEIIYENEKVLAFKDISPKAPVHVLIIPKKHISGILELNQENSCLAGEMITAAKEIAESSGLKDTGYRLVFNCGPDAGQAVFHLHLHLLGGRKLGWPPG
ncbi:MAG: histidine triad nucleotide-binding protein [Candidatus Omnitrophota bacterium]